MDSNSTSSCGSSGQGLEILQAAIDLQSTKTEHPRKKHFTRSSRDVSEAMEEEPSRKETEKTHQTSSAEVQNFKENISQNPGFIHDLLQKNIRFNLDIKPSEEINQLCQTLSISFDELKQLAELQGKIMVNALENNILGVFSRTGSFTNLKLSCSQPSTIVKEEKLFQNTTAMDVEPKFEPSFNPKSEAPMGQTSFFSRCGGDRFECFSDPHLQSHPVQNLGGCFGTCCHAFHHSHHCRLAHDSISSLNISPATGKAMLPYKGPRGQVFRFTTEAQNYMARVFEQKQTPDRSECQEIAAVIEKNYSAKGAVKRASWQQVRTWFKNRRFTEKNKTPKSRGKKRMKTEE